MTSSEAALLETVRKLEAEKVDLGDQVGHLRREIERQGTAHSAELDRQAHEHKGLLLSAQDRAEQLEQRLTAANERLEDQAEALRWAYPDPVKKEESNGELDDYKAENTRLVEFAQKVADSRTKYSPEAKKLLGQ